MFLDLRDNSGQIQVFCHESLLGERSREFLKLIDPGDLLGISGRVRRTQRGELTIAAESLTMLAKDLLPTAQSVSGSGEDIAAGPKRTHDHVAERRRLLVRAETVATIRTLMNSNLFQDAETWTAEPKVNLTPKVQLGNFMTPHFSGFLADGLSDRFYEINRHTADDEANLDQAIIVNAAQAFVDWREMMDLTEKLISSVSQRLRETGLIPETAARFSAPFIRKPMLEAIEDELGVDYSMIETSEEAREVTSLQGCDLMGNESWAECVTLAFVSKVAAKLITPVHITHLPKKISRLAVADQHDERLAEGFATYINGRLIASGSTILNDPFEYRERLTNGLEPAQAEAACGDEENDALAAALKRGVPPAAGMRAAMDRLVS
jgi:lysyl-tRNA synthetase class 2